MKSGRSTQEIRLFMGFPAIEDLCRELTGAGCSSAKAFQVHSGRKSSSRLWICEIDESLAEVSCSIFTVLRMLWSVGLKKIRSCDLFLVFGSKESGVVSFFYVLLLLKNQEL